MVYDPNWDYLNRRPANSKPGRPKHLPVNPSRNGGWDNPAAAKVWNAAGFRPPSSGTITRKPYFPRAVALLPPLRALSVGAAAADAARRATGRVQYPKGRKP